MLTTSTWIWIFFGLALVFGVLMTLPIGGADMPVVISIYNAFTGLAVGLEGFVLQNPALMIAGMVVGAAGLLLTVIMAKAMNRSIANVLFTNFGDGRDQGQARRHPRQRTSRRKRPTRRSRCATPRASSSCRAMAWRPPSAQQKLYEFVKLLLAAKVSVKLRHPSGGRTDARARWTCCWPRPACPTT